MIRISLIYNKIILTAGVLQTGWTGFISSTSHCDLGTEDIWKNRYGYEVFTYLCICDCAIGPVFHVSYWMSFVKWRMFDGRRLAQCPNTHDVWHKLWCTFTSIHMDWNFISQRFWLLNWAKAPSHLAIFTFFIKINHFFLPDMLDKKNWISVAL